MKRILHITNWYPSGWSDLEGVFVREQFKVFSQVSNTHLLNVQVRNSNKLFKYCHFVYSNNEEGFYILTRIKSTKILEILTSLLLLWSLFKSKYKTYDILHFHIAYPLLIYYSWWKKLLKTPIIISEHWSAYHFNFYLPKTTKKLKRVKYIFKQKIPVITVSNALLNDIKSFSKREDFQSIVIPNVLDKNYFKYRSKVILKDKPVFFMVNIWRKIKNPFPVLGAFSQLSKQGFEFELRIGGYGELITDMQSYITEFNLCSHVEFLGKLNKLEISNELSNASAYLYSSDYETFSVACAQALLCGCPLIGPPLPAILEYTEINKDIVLVEKNTKENWVDSLDFFVTNIVNYKRDEIARKANTLFSKKKIKKLYLSFVNAQLED